MKFIKNKKAFTLIELIVVVVVVGILVLLGMPRFIGHKDKAELARIQHDVKVMEQEIGTVFVSNGDEFNGWEDNSKDLNQLAQENKLVEKEGIAEAPIGGSYKVIPEKYKDKINTKLKGTFYANKDGKVYYEHEKPIASAEPEEEPGYSDEEIDDLVYNHVHEYIPVATADELNSIREDEERIYGAGTKWEGLYTGGLTGKKYVQVRNIDLSEYSDSVEGWNPIGSSSSSFTGTYDGGNYVITGLEIKGEDEDFQGLFGRTQGATIRNVGLIDNKVTGKDYVGGLVGNASYSMIENSYATGSVKGANRVGGLVGRTYGGTKITNSYATGEVKGIGRAGGLVGEADSSPIENSYVEGSVEGTGEVIGGLVGYASSSTKINNSYATGSVKGEKRVGGLVGWARDTTIDNSYTTGSVTGSYYVGGLVGYANDGGNIRNSYTTGPVKGSTVGGLVGWSTRTIIDNSYTIGDITGGNYAGGLVGNTSQAEITNSYATGDVTSTGETHSLGGLVGYNNGGVIENSYATGAVTGTGSHTVGGLSGDIGSGTKVIDSYATGSVTGTRRVGGLVGYASYSSAKISNSYATGSVTGKEYVGGLVGSSYSSVSNSYATGDVTGDGYTGGLVGYAQYSTNISNSYATGSVTGEDRVGGLAGDATSSTIENSYATGSVTGKDNVGGLVGQPRDTNTISNSYWDTKTTRQEESSGGEGKTTEEMKNQATYSGWDFESTWKIDEGKDYPKLR